jgi:hypothetical protein
MEMLSLIGGAASGFLFKLIANHQAEKAAQFSRLIDAIKASDESFNKAAQRVPPSDKSGNWTRRFLVISLVLSVLAGPMLLALINKPTVVEVITPARTFLGFWEYGGKTQFYELHGYLLSDQMRAMVSATFGYYFGISACKK